jgi:hypothetical protein
MSWKAIVDLIRGDRAAYTKVVMDGFKDLSEERKKDALEQKVYAEKLSAKVEALTGQVTIMAENEANCQRMLIEANANLLKNRERLLFIENIFIKLVKDRGLEVELPPPD